MSGAQGVPPTGQATPPAAPLVPAVPPVVQQHAAPPAGPAFQFSINGGLSSDFAAVQTHITALEGFRKETEEAAVENFVRNLAAPGVNKLLASQLEATLVWAKTQTPEQFAAWKAIQEGAPAHPIVGQQFGNSTLASEGAGSQQVSPAAGILQEYETVKAQVAMHTRAGVPQAQIEKMPSWTKMKALEPQVAAAQAQS